MILHAVVFKKPYYNTKVKCLKEAHHIFPKEDIKGFVRETPKSFRVRVVPKTQFINTQYILFTEKQNNGDIHYNPCIAKTTFKLISTARPHLLWSRCLRSTLYR